MIVFLKNRFSDDADSFTTNSSDSKSLDFDSDVSVTPSKVAAVSLPPEELHMPMVIDNVDVNDISAVSLSEDNSSVDLVLTAALLYNNYLKK